MDELQRPIDVELWLNQNLIRRQNFLKGQFIQILLEVGNSFSQRDFEYSALKPKAAKISRGNDLDGMPYQVLDLIRDFDSLEGANIRLLNWIGVGFFVTVLLGKDRANPIQEFLADGFLFGTSENKWDYRALILKKNYMDDAARISSTALGFHHWVKALPIVPDPNANVTVLIDQIKKILGILRLAKGTKEELT